MVPLFCPTFNHPWSRKGKWHPDIKNGEYLLLDFKYMRKRWCIGYDNFHDFD